MSTSTPRIVALVQARMGSSRLPGKVLKDLAGATALSRVLARLRRAETIHEVVVATSTAAGDDAVVAECARLGAKVFRGDEQDVLDRYYRAAQQAGADIAVRITADCPLIDPGITDKTVRAFLAERPDYASNALDRTYPRGLDTEVMTMTALDRAWKEATEPYQRAHVTPYLYQAPGRFRVLSVTGDHDYGALRWTLDTEPDLDFLRAVYGRFSGRDDFTWTDVVRMLESAPEISAINRAIRQKALHEG